MNIINPYELFGVTINTSISELKKIYYDLASLCHPDKGGNKNDMIIIKQAYEYIKKQLSNSENRLSLEEIQHDFDKYRNSQKIKLETFYDIHSKIHHGYCFNDIFEKRKKDLCNPFESGYGHYMETSTIKTDKYNIDATIHKPIKISFCKNLIKWNEPVFYPVGYGGNYQFGVKNIDDFSHTVNNLHLTDYMKAYDNSKDDYKYSIKEKTLDELINERTNFDKYIYKKHENTSNEYKLLFNKVQKTCFV